jgi:alginate O-acetyltransferase complex protein AlgJ
MLAALLVLGGLGLLTRWSTPVDVLGGQGEKASFNSLVDFPQNYGKSFNTNFVFRDDLIRLDYWSRYFLLRERVFPQVLIGENDWMFYSGEGNLDYYQRVKPLSTDQVGQIKSNLENIQKKLAADGIKFLFVIAPNKETIYADYLPAGIPRADNPTWADQITDSLKNTSVHVLDLRPVLQKTRQEAPVYFKTDTHWNPVGARAAYESILLAMRPDFPILQPHPLADFDQVTETSSGDLATLIHLKGEVNESFTALHARFEKPSRGLKNPPAGQMITVMPDAALPKAVIFRDSFFNGLQPFTSEHFSRVVYVSDFDVDFSIIAEEKPDMVILEVAERYLDRLLDKPTAE